MAQRARSWRCGGPWPRTARWSSSAPRRATSSAAGPRFIGGPLLSAFRQQRIVTFYASPKREDLLALKELIEAGKLTPIIDRTYPLSETADAIRYLETMQARGKVVITV